MRENAAKKDFRKEVLSPFTVPVHPLHDDARKLAYGTFKHFF